MHIEINGGKDGVAEYLITGQKKDRKFTRDFMDQRVTLSGDLEITNSIIKGLDFAENYHHITLSWKEDFVSLEDLQKVSDKFEKFTKTAYKDEEINFYSEAHIPKLKSYVSKNGEVVIRKPHIHIVTPNVNLQTGNYIEPFGYVEHNKTYINAFQELSNQIEGFESPKDNLRNEFNIESNVVARIKGDIFTRNKVEKEEILTYILDNKIEKIEDFKKYIETLGEVKIRNKNKDNAYLNLKLPHHNQGINFKEHCFSKEFIEEYSFEKKVAFLQKKTEEKFIEKKEAYSNKKTIQYKNLLKDWNDFKAREIKYINKNTKYYKEVYKNLSKEEKIEVLNQKEIEFYEKYNLKQEIEDFVKDVNIDDLEFVNKKKLTKEKIEKINNEYREKYKEKLIKDKRVGIDSLNTLNIKKELTKKEIRIINKIDIDYRKMQEKKLIQDKRVGLDSLNTLNTIEDIKNGRSRKDKINRTTKRISRVQEPYTRANRTFIAATKRDDLHNLPVIELVHDKYNSNKLLQSNVSSNLENKRSRRSDSILRRKRDSIITNARRGIKEYSKSNYISSKLNSFFEKKELENLDIKEDLIFNIYSKLKNEKGVLENKYKIDKNGIYINNDSQRRIGIKEFLGEELNMLAGEIQLLKDSIQRIEHDYNKKGKVMAIKINIKTNKKDNTKVDYYQMGKQDVAGRFTGAIADKASEHDTALAYAIDGKVVTLEQFKEKQPEMYKEIEDKTNTLFNINETERYNDKFRAFVKNRNISLSQDGFGHANSKYNFKELDPVEMGITKFEDAKKLDKNFFQIAKDFVTAKDFRDNIKVKMHDFKDKIKNLMISKPELAASNLVLAAQLQEMKIKLESIKTYQQALEKNQELSKELDPKIQQEKQEPQEQKEFSFKEILKEVKGLGDKLEDAKEISEIAQNPDFKDKRDTALELLNNLKEKPEVCQLKDTQIENLKLGEAKAVNLMMDNNLQVGSLKAVKEFVGVLKSVKDMSLEQNLDFENLLGKTLEKMEVKQQGKEQNQSKGMERE